jgi:hypothetical protein
MSRASGTRTAITRAAALGAAAGLGALGLASPATAATVSRHLAVDCPQPYSQTCTPRQGATITSSGPSLLIEFIADPNPPACAPAEATVYLDGAADGQYLVQVPHPQNVGEPAFWDGHHDMKPGTHQVDIQMTGVVGGCNTGSMSGWSGTLRVETDADALNDPGSPFKDFPAPAVPPGQSPGVPAPPQPGNSGPR